MIDRKMASWNLAFLCVCGCVRVCTVFVCLVLRVLCGSSDCALGWCLHSPRAAVVVHCELCGSSLVDTHTHKGHSTSPRMLLQLAVNLRIQYQHPDSARVVSVWFCWACRLVIFIWPSFYFWGLRLCLVWLLSY